MIKAPTIKAALPSLLLSLLALSTLPAQAAWQLDGERSRVEATVIAITPEGPSPHTHQIRDLHGDIDAEGRLRLPLRLAQADVLDRLGPLPPWLSGFTDRPLATLTTQLAPQRLDSLAVGDSRVETLTMRVEANGRHHQTPVPLRFSRLDGATIRVTAAERLVLDGQELMANPTLRGVLLMLGYEQIGDEVPVSLDALLIDR
ncbi:hypothetical protein HPA02_16090 [Bisbaumannia pacifica]|uniref:Lipid/polyisoprenoid-binding YceI-like domain-containing protein n=1 Tax=Bisbaumannia pacifica TaxID=77098 RepID=A0A510X7B2_9GAMM|nr:hypothetical protein [Halomonas pacifica]GEK47326.1 hypothetical protein HPA02_16090 [Halomonas pacifica]